MNDIWIYDSRRREKREFIPLDETNIRVYVCGPTVYDRAHIGNGRSAVVFDLLVRLLRHRYGREQVTYVRNITDIDDKIMARAREIGIQGDQRPLVAIVRELTETTIGWYHEDMAALATAPPTHEPRATGFVNEMIRMIADLIARQHAYVAADHVLFDVASFEKYGNLSNRSLAQMKAGSRVEVAPYKKHPCDFVLWKPSSAEQPGWDSPWGRGRPGWHIECSVMSAELLGTSFDIHGGGSDLLFPHHENELAQSCCAHPEAEFARYWMHNGFLRIEGDKMAKSAGNFLTVRELLDTGASGMAIRLALLATHYRRPLDWSVKRLHEAEQTLAEWSRIADCASGSEIRPEVANALADDMNSPAAITAMHRLADAGDAAGLKGSASLLGLQFEPRQDEVQLSDEQRDRIAQLLRLREEARARKEFVRADRIRGQLAEAGIAVSDSHDGTNWTLHGPLDLERLVGKDDLTDPEGAR